MAALSGVAAFSEEYCRAAPNKKAVAFIAGPAVAY
jgi:hypothetical protein